MNADQRRREREVAATTNWRAGRVTGTRWGTSSKSRRPSGCALERELGQYESIMVKSR